MEISARSSRIPPESGAVEQASRMRRSNWIPSFGYRSFARLQWTGESEIVEALPGARESRSRDARCYLDSSKNTVILFDTGSLSKLTKF